MKTFASCFLFVFYCSISVGQNYVPFPDSNAVWRGNLSYLISSTQFELHSIDYHQMIDGDTMINGLTYHKIYETGVHNVVYIGTGNGGSYNYNHLYAGAFREDSSKHIFSINTFNSVEELIYDFNLTVGDTLPPSPNHYANIWVSNIDSILDGTIFRKRFTLSADTIPASLGYINYVSLIEGIGSTHGLLWTLDPYFENGGELFCFKENGSIKYFDSTYSNCSLVNVKENQFQESIFALSPNPATEILNIKSEKTIAFPLQLLVMDMQGKLMEEKIVYNNDDLSVNVKSFSNAPYFVIIKNNERVLFHSIFLKE